VRAIVESLPNPKIVCRLHNLCFDAPLAAVDEFGSVEPMVRVELKQQLTGWSLWRG
jgi:hypothetical protein